jgi:hypothetical protein
MKIEYSDTADAIYVALVKTQDPYREDTVAVAREDILSNGKN